MIPPAVALVVLVLAAVLLGYWIGRPPAAPATVPTAPTLPRCGGASDCHARGWIVVTRRRERTTARVCAGCYARGSRFGWWL